MRFYIRKQGEKKGMEHDTWLSEKRRGKIMKREYSEQKGDDLDD